MTDTDIGALLGVSKPAEPAAADDIFYADVLTGLRELIPCEDITFQLMDGAEQRQQLLFVTDDGVHREEVVGANDDLQRLYWREFWEEDGSAGPLITCDYSTLLHRAEIWGPPSWANTPLGSFYAAVGVTDDILVPMTPLGGTDRHRRVIRRDAARRHACAGCGCVSRHEQRRARELACHSFARRRHHVCARSRGGERPLRPLGVAVGAGTGGARGRRCAPRTWLTDHFSPNKRGCLPGLA